MVRAAIAVCIAALVCTGASAGARTGGPTTQDVTITGAGGVQLACKFVLPAGTPPAGGWPGLILFPGLHGSPTDGTASPLPASRRSRAPSGAGVVRRLVRPGRPEGREDAQAIFDWLAARPEVSDTQIGAEGTDLGGAEVWNAAVAGVPFKAIVATTAWSSLGRALKPTGVLNAKPVPAPLGGGPTPWNTASGIAARSYSDHLHSLAVPTLMLNGREDYFFDLEPGDGPVRAAVRAEAPRHRLEWSVGGPVMAWFRRYLAGGPRAGTGTGVVLQHEPPDATATTYLKLPPTRIVSVNLPGAALTRSVWLTGGPLETFGGGSVTIRYTALRGPRSSRRSRPRAGRS